MRNNSNNSSFRPYLFSSVNKYVSHLDAAMTWLRDDSDIENEQYFYIVIFIRRIVVAHGTRV